MRYFLIFIFTSCLFSQSMDIDKNLIVDSNKTLKWAMIPLLSQGQIQNDNHIKSLFFYSAQSYCLSRVIMYNDLMPTNYNLKKRNDLAWYLIGFYISSIIDAYVDSELSNFPKRIF